MFNELFFSGERSSLAFERLGSFMSREEVRIQSFLINTVVFQVLSQETGSMPDRPPIWVYLKRVNYGSVDPLLKSNFLLDMIFFFQEIMSLLVLKRERRMQRQNTSVL